MNKTLKKWSIVSILTLTLTLFMGIAYFSGAQDVTSTVLNNLQAVNAEIE